MRHGWSLSTGNGTGVFDSQVPGMQVIVDGQSSTIFLLEESLPWKPEQMDRQVETKVINEKPQS